MFQSGMMNVFQIVLLLITTPLAVLWIWFAAFRGKRYERLTNHFQAKKLQMHFLFCVGFSLMDFLHIDVKKRWAQERVRDYAEIYGRQYAEFYYYLQLGSAFTYGYTILVVFLLLSVLANSVEVLLFGILMTVLVVVYMRLSTYDRLTERRQEILMDLPQVTSKLSLLVNTGMVLREAWKRTAYSGNRVLYREMQTTMTEIQNGQEEQIAYRNFGDRCNLKEVRKLASLINQNLSKGNEELSYYLRDMTTEMWEMKRNEVKQKGEKANSQLLLPIMLIFLGIMILILVPIMNGMG